MTKLALLAITLSTACTVGEDGPATLTYEQFVARHIQQDQDADGTTYLSYDWDTPLDSMDEVNNLYAAYVQVRQTGEQVSAALVKTSGGKDVIWPAAMRTNLTYCVSNAFGANKAAVVAAMSTATAAWTTATVGRIKYVYVPAQDANCTNANLAVLFNVVPIAQQSSLLARAFFPNAARELRQVLVNTTTTLTPNAVFPLAGVLRHELGHSLGLRHETIRPDTAEDYGTQCLEDMFYRELTGTFDEDSVMITPACLGRAEVLRNNPTLDISLYDKVGIKKLYP